DPERELAIGLGSEDRARRPVDRPSAVALHVAPEPGTHGRAGGALEPLGLEGRGAVPTDLGDVAHQIPDPLRWGGHVDGDRVAHGRTLWPTAATGSSISRLRANRSKVKG